MGNVFWEYTPVRNQRLDPDLYALPGQACFFTVRAFHPTAPFRHSTFAKLAVSCLLAQAVKSECSIAAYCLMPDHLHVVVGPLRDGASSLTLIERFKGWSTREIHRAGWPGKIWQSRYYDHLIRKDENLTKIAAYILHNPVRKGLVDDPHQYPWSGTASSTA